MSSCSSHASRCCARRPHSSSARLRTTWLFRSNVRSGQRRIASHRIQRRCSTDHASYLGPRRGFPCRAVCSHCAAHRTAALHLSALCRILLCCDGAHCGDCMRSFLRRAPPSSPPHAQTAVLRLPTWCACARTGRSPQLTPARPCARTRRMPTRAAAVRASAGHLRRALPNRRPPAHRKARKLNAALRCARDDRSIRRSNTVGGQSVVDSQSSV